MTPQSAKLERNLHGKYLRPLQKYRQAKSLEDYFEQRVSVPDDAWNTCWKFNTKVDKDGYSQITGSKHAKKLGLTRAHQASYYLHKGNIPNDKMVCHTCDRPWCVNPNHLFLGSPNDNVQDMMNKGRYKHPTEYGKFIKITPEQKQQIMSLKGIKSSLTVGKEFNVSFSRVCQIWRGE